MNVTELQALKRKLPYGWANKASKELGYSKSTITNMMNGRSSINVNILDHLITMAEEHTKIQLDLTSRINRLNSKN